MQVVPSAIGQSQDVLVVWVDEPEVGLAFPRTKQLVNEFHLGMGTTANQECLILYLFAGEQSLELCFPRQLATTPDTELDVWQLLWDWNPDILKLRYGESPIDNSKEVTLLLPRGQEESFRDRLKELNQIVNRSKEEGGVAQLHKELAYWLEMCLKQSDDNSNWGK